MSNSLQALLGALNIDAELAADILLRDIAIDSRLVEQGALFCAYPGDTLDGRDFIADAVSSGAVAVLCDSEGDSDCSSETESRAINMDVPIIKVDGLKAKVGALAHEFFGQPSSNMQIFGVTGTNGKTTCCYLLVQALNQLGMQAAMIGTIGLGRLDQLQANSHTTPDPISVHRQLAQWLDQGITQVCMEVSSHALDQGRVAGVEFFCTLFTNLSHDHLDYHGDMQQYAAAKQSLFTDYTSELVITNADDELGSRLIDVANSGFIASYGDAGDVSIESAVLASDGMQILIVGNGVEFEIHTPLIGKVNLPNVLLLVTTLLSLSTSIEDIQKIAANLQAAPGRMELYANANHPSVVVDYAHTPDALEKALLSVREHCKGQLWCVFGCGGDRDKAKRSVMGAAAERYADRIVVTNDNPRSEDPAAIAEDILTGMQHQHLVVLDRAQAIHDAIAKADSGDWVLVAGKGHETTQQIGEQILQFSDRQQVAENLGVAA